MSAVLFIDLDHFKEVNDTLGHPVGDVLLCHVADRIRSCVRETDMVGRLGGDEFAVVQPGIPGRGEAAKLAQRVLGTICAPYFIDDQTLHIDASIGIALVPEHGGGPDEIFKNADIALYCAKADERGTYRFFEPAMEARLQTKQRLKADLAAALGRSELALAFQPIVDLHTNTVVCMEALLRWEHPLHQSIPPSRFIPVAEETGLIVPIGEWALRMACAAAVAWPESIGVAVNVSALQFATGNLPNVIRSILFETGLAPERLEIEITESVLLQNSDANLRTLQRIRALGVRTALDDFGTGFASLGYLQKFAFDKIKIDRSFVSVFQEHRESHAIVKAVTGLGRTLGIQITAEGVETRQQLEQARAVGCDEAQGFFFSQAVHPEQIPDLLQGLATARNFWDEPIVPHTTAVA
jgi:diguanylate cyclase (GGDEF)-like protein